MPILFIILLFSCNTKNKSSELASYSYEEEKVEMSEELKAKFPEWVEEGKICYGLVVQVNKEGESIKGKPVKAKVVQLGRNAVKMKALESVSLMETVECTKMGLAKGQTWDEDEGDLFLTYDDAINYLKEKNLYNFSDRVTVD